MLTRVEELKLISQVALSDNRRAFARLVDAYQSTVRGFFLNLTAGDYALSDDLAQETFLKAYTNIRSFKGLSKFKTWLLRIAYNEFYSYVRKHSARSVKRRARMCQTSSLATKRPMMLAWMSTLQCGRSPRWSER